MKNLLFAIRPLAMDLLSTLIFVALSALTHDPILATAIAVGVGVLQVAYLKARGRPVSAMQWMSLGLVVVFGGATLFTHNARFMMFKPTIIYVLVGGAMLQRGWMLPYLPPVARGPVGDQAMTAWGYVWAGLMFVTALANLASRCWRVSRSGPPSSPSSRWFPSSCCSRCNTCPSGGR